MKNLSTTDVQMAVEHPADSGEESPLTAQSSGNASVAPSVHDDDARTSLLDGQSPRASEEAVSPGDDTEWVTSW